MAEEVKTTPAEGEKKTEPTISEVVEKKETPKEETVGNVVNPVKKEESVPLSAFLEIKNSNKELSKQMKDLQKSIEDGANKKEVSSDIKAIAEQHGVDESFLKDFADSIKKQAESEIDEKISSRFKPLEDKDKAEKFSQTFEQHYAKALERMPEYDGVASKEVIKSLVQNPANASKTFSQLIEEAYGHLIQGKKTLDAGGSRGNKNDNLIVDINKAKKDPAYFKEVMADPNLKKQYNDALTGNLQSSL